ncbi:hypothetical protein [Vibrio cidicii]|uniref:hypothetical protein n=1 Tax=Vibrio cidicii TaxID=1763883 RepID=UPI0018C30C53|nr:hypothetical protein [Vibrio cidicii]MBG0757516.1 hypothetical protein [Vibrio cidicii]
MNIKQSVIFFLLLTGVSFSAFSETKFYQIDGFRSYRSDCKNADTGLNLGDVVSYDYLKSISSCGQSPVTKVVFGGSGGGGYLAAKLYYSTTRLMDIGIRYVSGCPTGQEFNTDTQKCEEPQPETCEDLKYKDAPSPGNRVPDDGKPLTATRSYCDTSTMCEAAHFWFASDDGMHVSNTYTGFDCVGTPSDYADSPWYADRPVPEPEPEPDPTHTPTDNTGPIEDPSVLPDSSTTTPSVDPDPVDPKPDVPTPDPTPDSNGDVVQSVVNMNTDINKLLTDLNEDLNKDNADIQAELKALNEQALDNTKAIVDLHVATKQAAENEKSLLLGINTDVTTAVNKVANAVNTGMGKLEGDLQGIGDMLGGKGLVVVDHGSLINFGETPLYQESEVEKLTQEVEDLKEQYTEKVNNFKKLFSLNLDSLSNGEYREHFLDFEFANGAKLRAGSSVFPALIDNSGLIAAVILFVAVIAGLRVVMGAKD